jgi:sirohydrochlorin ferrochelatase
MSMADLHTQRAQQVNRHGRRSHIDAALREAKHRQLRRELRIEQVRQMAKAAAEFGAAAIFITAVLIWAGVLPLPV